MRQAVKMMVWVALSSILSIGIAQAQELTGTLKKIKDSGAIVLGHRESSVPFSFLDGQQKPVGYSMDLCLKVVDAVKAELGLSALEVKYVPVTSSTRIPLMANGTIDLECGSTTNNLTRQKQVSFAPTTFITGTRLLIKKKSKIKEIEDLKGKTVALTQGTTNERAIKAISDEKKLDIKFLNVKDHAEGFLVLETGRADAFSTDDILLFGLITKAKKPADYAVVGRYLSYDPYGIMMRRDDAAFQLVVTKTLAGLFRSGEINQIYAKWFTEMGVPQSDLLKAAIQIQALPE
jgi:glutamate/aspartate transport system substrate-binding protein